MKILGISCYYHDAAAAVVENGQIIVAAQEERFTRVKHDASFPSNAISYCMKASKSSWSELEAIVFYDKPFLKFERLVETYYYTAPRGLKSFIAAIPVWIKEKLFLKSLIRSELKKIGNISSVPISFTEHHLSHAASAFYPSNFESAAIVTIDGVGEWATATICHGQGNKIKVLKELRFPHSVGLLYSAFTYYLGFKVNSGEYKLMGLAPYGNRCKQTSKFEEIIKSHLIKIYDDGSIWMNQKFFNYSAGLTMTKDKGWLKLFNLPRRLPESPIQQDHCNLALAIQHITEEIVLKMAGTAKKLTGESNLCLAGGVALNCVANGKLHQAGIFDKIFIQPASGDAGGAPGAALAAYHIGKDQPRIITAAQDLMNGAYLGPDISDHEIDELISQNKPLVKAYSNQQELTRHIAQELSHGKVIGWVQGRMEFGPRALGNRSILGDPRNPEMQQKINLKIKYRESFRPFAPAVLAEEAKKHFQLDTSSPYMLLAVPVNDQMRNKKPNHYDQLGITEKLRFERSTLPAITHIDYSARVQTVHEETNPLFHQLLTAFAELTGCGVMINTSFNVRGEPIVSNAKDAYRCFMETEMDLLVINNYVFDKKHQTTDIKSAPTAYNLD